MASTNDPKRGGPAVEPPRRAGQTERTRDPQRPKPPSGEPDVGRQPKQPNERDESSASQQTGPRRVMRQAAEDVEQGRRDTSRGEATDATYAREFRDESVPTGGEDGSRREGADSSTGPKPR